jgi:hypothetical protein
MIETSQIKSPRHLSIFATGLPSGDECLELEQKNQIYRMISQIPSWHDATIFYQISGLFSVLMRLKGYCRQAILRGAYILNSIGKGLNPQIDIIKLIANAANGKNRLVNSMRLKISMCLGETGNHNGASKSNGIGCSIAQCYTPGVADN